MILLLLLLVEFCLVNGKYAKYQRFMNYHEAEQTNMRAKRFRSFHTSDQEHDPEAIQPKDHQNNFKDILESCDFIDPDMDSFVCRKAKMLGHMLDNHPGPDNHKKWKVCNDLLHKLDLQDMTTRKQLNAYCLSYMQKLYNKSKRTEYLHTRGVGGKSKIFRLHFGNN